MGLHEDIDWNELRGILVASISDDNFNIFLFQISTGLSILFLTNFQRIAGRNKRPFSFL